MHDRQMHTGYYGIYCSPGISCGKVLEYRERTLQRVLEFGICWFAVRERTRDCGSWADVMTQCSVPTPCSLQLLGVPLNTNNQDINTSCSTSWDLLQRAILWALRSGVLLPLRLLVTSVFEHVNVESEFHILFLDGGPRQHC